jgi:hypothetical protein
MKTFGTRATEALFALFDKAKLSGQPRALARENIGPDMVDLLDDMANRARLQMKIHKIQGRPTELDGIWIEELEQMPAYRGVDVKRELGKCQAWASTKNPPIVVTRKRFINWLNRAEANVRPLSVNGHGKSSFDRPKPEQQAEPVGWRQVLVEIHPTVDREALKEKSWADLSPPTRAEVLNRINR